MLASKLLPEQEEQNTHQLQSLQQQQGLSGSKQQAAHVQVLLNAIDIICPILLSHNIQMTSVCLLVCNVICIWMEQVLPMLVICCKTCHSTKKLKQHAQGVMLIDTRVSLTMLLRFKSWTDKHACRFHCGMEQPMPRPTRGTFMCVCICCSA